MQQPVQKRSLFVGIDIGGTKILAAVATPEGRILARAKKKTLPKVATFPQDPVWLSERITETALAAIEKAGVPAEAIRAVGVGAPGPTNIYTGRVLTAVNLPGWHNGFDLGPVLSEALNMPVYVDNDVNVGLLGEHTFGAARGLKDVVGLFVGTGLGGALILDGKLRRGFRWSAGEVGHTYLYWPGQQPMDIEHIASRGAISKQLTSELNKGRSPILESILSQRSDRRITSGVIRKALAKGDPATQRAIAQTQEAIAVLIASIANLLDPEAFVLGGGLVESLGESFLEPIREKAYPLFFVRHRVEEVQLMPAALGDDSGVLGAVALAKSLAD